MRGGGRAIYRPAGKGAPTLGVVCRVCLAASVRVVVLVRETPPALRLPRLKRTGLLSDVLNGGDK